MSVTIGSTFHMNLRIVKCVCPFVYFLRQYIFNCACLEIFTVAIFNNSSWRSDTTYVVIVSSFL